MSNRNRIATITGGSFFAKDHVFAEAVNTNAGVLATHDTQIESLLIADKNHCLDIENLIGAVNAMGKRIRVLEAELANRK